MKIEDTIPGSPRQTKTPTELIVSLDGPDPLRIMRKLSWETDHAARWFKVGPQTMARGQWDDIIATGAVTDSLNIFLDLKLADIADTVREAIKRFANAGVAAVSTFTEAATTAAAEGAWGTPLKVWQVLNLSDDELPDLTRMPPGCAAGAICSGRLAEMIECHGRDKIVPGIRFGGSRDGHHWVMDPRDCARYGVTHAVVGRPIWQATDPVAAARDFISALGGVHA